MSRKKTQPFNTKKTKCVTAWPTAFKGFIAPNLYINGNVLCTVSEETYLGVPISNDCCDDKAILKELRGLCMRGNILLRFFRNCSTDVKTKLFLTYCNNFYCCSLWNLFKQSTLKRFIVRHNRIFRKLLNASHPTSISQLFVQHRISNFIMVRRKLVSSLFKRLFSNQH